MGFIPGAVALAQALTVSSAATAAGTVASATAVNIAGAAIATTVAASIASPAIASHKAAGIAEDEATYNAAVARNNALTSMRDAEISATAGQLEGDRIRSRSRRNADSQVAASAASGLQIQGSVNDVLLDSYIQGEQDALLAEYQGTNAAHRSGAQAGNFFNQGTQLDSRAKNARSTGDLNVTSSILGGVAKAGFGFAQFAT